MILPNAFGKVSIETADSLIDSAWVTALEQLDSVVVSITSYDSLPMSLHENGSVFNVSQEDWRAGFFAGCLLYAYEKTQDQKYIAVAESLMIRFEDQKLNNETHDVGFVLYSSYGNHYRLTGNESFKQVCLTGAASLAQRYNTTVGAIRSWGPVDRADYQVIIDNMLNLELLYWASNNGGGAQLAEMSNSHAEKTMLNHIRSDNSTYHVVDYNQTTGGVDSSYTNQGYADESCWSRGQSWGVYGFTMCYRESQDPRWLTTAKKLADYFLDSLPADTIPYWDYNAPDIPNAPRDASAAAIAASGLLELATYCRDEDEIAKYWNGAIKLLTALCGPTYQMSTRSPYFILDKCTGNWPTNSEIEVPLVYGDYYFLEALLRYAKLKDQVIESSVYDQLSKHKLPIGSNAKLNYVYSIHGRRIPVQNRNANASVVILPGKYPKPKLRMAR